MTWQNAVGRTLCWPILRWFPGKWDYGAGVVHCLLGLCCGLEEKIEIAIFMMTDWSLTMRAKRCLNEIRFAGVAVSIDASAAKQVNRPEIRAAFNCWHEQAELSLNAMPCGIRAESVKAIQRSNTQCQRPQVPLKATPALMDSIPVPIIGWNHQRHASQPFPNYAHLQPPWP